MVVFCFLFGDFFFMFVVGFGELCGVFFVVIYVFLVYMFLYLCYFFVEFVLLIMEFFEFFFVWFV